MRCLQYLLQALESRPGKVGLSDQELKQLLSDVKDGRVSLVLPFSSLSQLHRSVSTRGLVQTAPIFSDRSIHHPELTLFSVCSLGRVCFLDWVWAQTGNERKRRLVREFGEGSAGVEIYSKLCLSSSIWVGGWGWRDAMV